MCRIYTRIPLQYKRVPLRQQVDWAEALHDVRLWAAEVLQEVGPYGRFVGQACPSGSYGRSWWYQVLDKQAIRLVACLYPCLVEL